MENRVITISREYGSGGRMIGRKLAEKLGIHCYEPITSRKKGNPRQEVSSLRFWRTGQEV